MNDVTAAAATWQEQMEAVIAQTERAAHAFARMGLFAQAVDLQREASELRAELAAGFYGVTW